MMSATTCCAENRAAGTRCWRRLVRRRKLELLRGGTIRRMKPRDCVANGWAPIARMRLRAEAARLRALGALLLVVLFEVGLDEETVDLAEFEQDVPEDLVS